MPVTLASKSGQDSCRRPVKLIVTKQRAVYGTREGQKIEAVPLDERLQLPQEKNSYLLQDWDQELAVQMPYAAVSATLERILGFEQSVHTLERNQREMAVAAEDFWSERPTPPPEQEGGDFGVHGRLQGGADARWRQTARGDGATGNRRDAPRIEEDGLARRGLYDRPLGAHPRRGVGGPVCRSAPQYPTTLTPQALL
jgi:hypothetical protein